jgi:hypothetical protein
MLVSIYWILREKEPYKELGENYLKKRNLVKKLKYHQKQIEDLGYNTVIFKDTKITTT